MYAISFRIFLAKIGNQKVFINGSALSPKRLTPGTSVFVQGNALSVSTAGYHADVITCVASKREAASFDWEILDG